MAFVAVVRQSSGSRQAVVRQSSGSRQAVVRQSSGSRQAVVSFFCYSALRHFLPSLHLSALHVGFRHLMRPRLVLNFSQAHLLSEATSPRDPYKNEFSFSYFLIEFDEI